MSCNKELFSDAVFSRCRKYRYVLWRIWDESKPYAMFIGLNPSTADEVKNDPTVTRCINYSRLWEYGGLCMTNIFAYRAKDPKDMRAARDPIGKENDTWIVKSAKNAGVIVCVWGNHGQYLSRSREVLNLIRQAYYLKMNKSGEPAHPLYLRRDLEPQYLSCPDQSV